MPVVWSVVSVTAEAPRTPRDSSSALAKIVDEMISKKQRIKVRT
jgi:hypothetical protein